MPNRNYVAMEALVAELARCGVRDACLCPGNRSAPLAFALAREAGIRLWTHVDERSAGFFALGLARATRRPVAVACTSGTAAANLVPAAVEAHHARVPLVLLTADRPPELRERSAAQTIDQAKLYGSHARWSFDPGPPEPTEAGLRHVRAAACRAVSEAWGAPAGVAHLNLPMRDPLDPFPEEGIDVLPDGGRLRAEPHTEAARVVVSPSPEQLRRVAALLEGARRPLVYCGPLDAEDVALVPALRALAERLGAPVLAEPISNLRRPELGAHLVDVYEALLRAPEFAAAADPDVVLRLGGPPTSRTVATWLDARDAELVVVDEPGGWADPSCRASHLVRGSTVDVCRALADGVVRTGARPGWLEQWVRAVTRARAALGASLEAGPAPFEGHVVRAVAQVLPPSATVYVASSLAVRDLDWFWPDGPTPVRFLANRGANGIDGFASSVLGAAAGGERVLGLCGDLSFFHDVSGLVAARRLGLRACFVVQNNGGGGIFDFLPAAKAPAGYAEHYEDLFVTPLGLELGLLVRAFDVGFERVDTVAGIAPAVARAWESDRTSVVEVAIDRSESRAGHARAWRAVAEAGR